MDKLDKLKDLLKLLQDDTVKPQEIKEFLEVVLGFIKKSKDEFHELSAENIRVIKEVLNSVEKEKLDVLVNVSQETTKQAKKDLETTIKEIKGLMKEVEQMKPKDGKDGADGQDGLPGKDGSPDTRKEIVEKINTGKKKDLKIELEQIETGKLEKSISDRALSILDQRTKFLINKTVKVDGVTITGDGTDQHPLVSVGGGGGTVGPGTINEIAYFDTTTSIASLTVATYPSLTELSYVKGVTSAIQTQLNAKLASTFTKAQLDTAVTDGNVLFVGDITQYTDELAQDAVGGMVANSTFINLAYVDATPSLTASLSATGTPDSTTFLRGDNTWASVGGGTTNAFAETPTGLVNSSNVTYTLANTPADTDGVIVLLDGVVQYNGVDYTVSGSTITFVAAPATGSSIFAYYNTFTAGGAGTVTSVAMTVPTGLTISGSPVTTTGTLAVALDTGYVIPLQSTLDGFVTEDQTVGQTIGATGARLTKLWATDITVTNAITGSVTGTAATVTGAAQTAITSLGTLTGLTMGGTLAMGTNSITMTGSIAATGARVTKGWFTDIESTNMPTVGGTSLSATFAPISSTKTINLMQHVMLDATGDAFFEPYSILATNDSFRHAVLRLGANNAAAPTVKSGFYASIRIPEDYNTSGTVTIEVEWTSTLTSGDAVFDFDYRSIGGNDTESLDQSGYTESLTVTDTAPSAANEKMTATMTVTASNLAAGDILEFFSGRDGADAADTLAGSAIVHSVILKYTT